MEGVAMGAIKQASKSGRRDFFAGKSVLITGGSSGIGMAIARQVTARNAHVWLIARDPVKLTAAKNALETIRKDPTQIIGTTSADVAQEEQVRKAVDEAIAGMGLPDIIINSAGVVYPGYFEALDGDIFRRMMDINYFGTLHVIRAVVPGMIARGSGHILNISSMAGVLAIFGYSAYGASKFAVRGLSDTLRWELKPRGIRVSIAFPPDTDTPQLAFETPIKPFETKSIAGNGTVFSAERVAQDILDGIERDRYIILTGLDSKLFYTLANVLGPWLFPVMDMFVADASRKKAAQSQKK
jgi:3-dehydrosphinganine reductase